MKINFINTFKNHKTIHILPTLGFSFKNDIWKEKDEFFISWICFCISVTKSD